MEVKRHSFGGKAIVGLALASAMRKTIFGGREFDLQPGGVKVFVLQRIAEHFCPAT